MTNNKPAIIYIIRHKDKNIKGSYIGSTQNFETRLTQHISDSKRCKRPLYQHIRASGGFDNWEMTPLCYVMKYRNDNEFRLLERFYCNLYKTTYNINTPSRTIKEWRKDNKEKVKIHYHNWRNKPCNRETVKKKAREYNAKHKEKIKQTTLKYYKKNKEKIKKINNGKLMCICGAMVNRSHLKSGTHKFCKKHHNNALCKIIEQKKKLKSNDLNINTLV
tara:strand:- start:573 stop:1229 length:657 start_codon:yes stop_codon:yes gene_type:complete